MRGEVYITYIMVDIPLIYFFVVLSVKILNSKYATMALSVDVASHSHKHLSGGGKQEGRSSLQRLLLSINNRDTSVGSATSTFGTRLIIAQHSM